MYNKYFQIQANIDYEFQIIIFNHLWHATLKKEQLNI